MMLSVLSLFLVFLTASSEAKPLENEFAFNNQPSHVAALAEYLKSESVEEPVSLFLKDNARNLRFVKADDVDLQGFDPNVIFNLDRTAEHNRDAKVFDPQLVKQNPTHLEFGISSNGRKPEDFNRDQNQFQQSFSKVIINPNQVKSNDKEVNGFFNGNKFQEPIVQQLSTSFQRLDMTSDEIESFRDNFRDNLKQLNDDEKRFVNNGPESHFEVVDHRPFELPNIHSPFQEISNNQVFNQFENQNQPQLQIRPQIPNAQDEIFIPQLSNFAPTVVISNPQKQPDFQSLNPKDILSKQQESLIQNIDELGGSPFSPTIIFNPQPVQKNEEQRDFIIDQPQNNVQNIEPLVFQPRAPFAETVLFNPASFQNVNQREFLFEQPHPFFQFQSSEDEAIPQQQTRQFTPGVIFNQQNFQHVNKRENSLNQQNLILPFENEKQRQILPGNLVGKIIGISDNIVPQKNLRSVVIRDQPTLNFNGVPIYPPFESIPQNFVGPNLREKNNFNKFAVNSQINNLGQGQNVNNDIVIAKGFEPSFFGQELDIQESRQVPQGRSLNGENFAQPSGHFVPGKLVGGFRPSNFFRL